MTIDNMKHTLKLFRRIAAAVSGAMLVAAAATSCVSDETQVMHPGARNGNGNDNTEVLLRLRTPGGFAAPDDTRALTFAQENAVNDVWVLAVDEDEDKIVAIAKGKNPDFDPNADYDGPGGTNADTNSGSGTFAVDLPQELKGETVKLVVLANAEDILEGVGYIQLVDGKFVPVAGVAVGKSYTNVRTSLIGNLASGQDGEIVNSIPMWGEMQMTVSPSASPTITLTRAVARLDVGLGTPSYDKTKPYPWSWDGKDATNNDIPFELTGVEVNSRTNQYYLIPELDADGDPILSQKIDTQRPLPTPYAGTGVITAGDYTTQNIYLPESGAVVNIANPTMDDADHNSRTYIIVEGIYTGDNSANTTPTFYRLDFADEDENLLDVLRNHLYRFNITNVDGPGYTYIDNARTSRPMNMTAELVEIDETASGHTVFDDEYYLSVDPVELTFDAVAGSQNLTLQTDYPGWTAAVSANEDGSDAAAWLTVDPDSGTDNGEAAQTLTVTAEANPSTTTVRTAWITVKAGRLTFKVKVTQDRSLIPGILAAPGVIGYIKGTNTLTIRGSKEYLGTLVMTDPGNTDIATSTSLATGEPLENATVYVAYFKFGSLVGVRSERPGVGVSYPFSDNIIARPSQWTGTVTDFASIPYVTLTGTNQEIMVDGVSQGKVSAAQATGDPCIYWATQYGWGDWKLPTVGTAAQRGFDADGGFPFATSTSGNELVWTNATIVAKGADWIDKTEVTPNMPEPGAVGGDGAGNHDWSMFLPAVGNGNSGNFTGRTSAYYMTSTWSDATLCNSLYFTMNTVHPANRDNPAIGFGVRCVPTVTP